LRLEPLGADDNQTNLRGHLVLGHIRQKCASKGALRRADVQAIMGPIERAHSAGIVSIGIAGKPA
jgi:hypothetical protein